MATKKPKTKKGRKQDAALISKEKHEIKYAAKKAAKSQKVVRAAKAKVGRSRKKIEAELKK